MHKFFSLGQLPETNLDRLVCKPIELVVRKLDGQMVSGVLVGDEVQFWSRAGPTQVGMDALRAAENCTESDYAGFVRYAATLQSTPCFEFVGKCSHIKAFEGNMPRVVLLACRFHTSGDYWEYRDMERVAGCFGVPVVERLQQLEVGTTIADVRDVVRRWHNCEGVVVRFRDRTWVKVKSDWWEATGYSPQFTERVVTQVMLARERLAASKARLQHHSLRLALTCLVGDENPEELRVLFPSARRIELVYRHSGRLSLVMLAFATARERNFALRDPANSELGLQPAYSCRTRTNHRQRVVAFTY
jgi:hypothetical protein